jgi:hypothetical protein
VRIEPQPDRLLRRICDSLEKMVLADMAAPEAERQLKTSLWTLRRIADSLCLSDDLLREEIADMESVLAAHGGSCAPAIENGAGGLRARHRALQEQLIEVDRRAQLARANGNLIAGQAVRDLRALYRRMLERENAVRPSPGGEPT